MMHLVCLVLCSRHDLNAISLNLLHVLVEEKLLTASLLLGLIVERSWIDSKARYSNFCLRLCWCRVKHWWLTGPLLRDLAIAQNAATFGGFINELMLPDPSSIVGRLISVRVVLQADGVAAI